MGKHMTVADNQHSVLLENVYKLINKKVSPDQVEQITSFSKILFKNISWDDLDNRSDDNLYGATLSLWNQFVDYQGEAPFIRAFNPAISKHGWQSNHTIVEIIVTDMPFLVDSVRMALNKMGITTHLLLHCPIGLKRDEEHKFISFETSANFNASSSETAIFPEV
jgi:glutamate dehydrogenase